MGLAETAKLLASLDLDDKAFTAGSKRTMGSVSKLESSFDKIGASAKRGIGTAAANLQKLALVGAGAAVGIIGESIRLASDLNETQSKVGVVFGSSAREVLDFGKSSAAGLGMSENAAEAAAATYGNLFVSMGFAADKSADMSMGLVKLAGDLASFNNLDPSEVMEKLRAGLTGEAEPLKTLGININDTVIKAKALEMGLVKTTQSTAQLKLNQVALTEATKAVAEATRKHGAGSKEALKAIVAQEKAQAALEGTTAKIPATLDAATKAQAAYALIFEQTTTAQGDFARTSSGLANQQRILKANLENVGAVIGTAVLPKVAQLVQRINELVVNNQPAIREFADLLPGAFDAALNFAQGIPFEAIGDALRIAGMGAQAIAGAFEAMPPWVQTAVITGWGLNKLTGGAVADIVGELGKGLIKGVLGMNAGVVNINAAVVNGGIGPNIGPTGGKGGIGDWLSGAVAAILASARNVFSGGKITPTDYTGMPGPNGVYTPSIGAGIMFDMNDPKFIAATERLQEKVDAKRAAAATVAAGPADQRSHYAESMAGLDRTLVADQRSHFDDLNSTLTAAGTDAVRALDTLHTDLQTQLGVLRTSKDPAAIAAGATALVKDILSGAGGVTSNTNMLEQLKTARQYTAPGSADRKVVDAAIAQVTSHIKGEEWIRAQVNAARDIVQSNKPTHAKLDTLDSTVENLLRHGDTNAAEMIRQIAAKENISITINGLKATVTATDVNEGTTTAKRKGRFSTTASSWT